MALSWEVLALLLVPLLNGLSGLLPWSSVRDPLVNLLLLVEPSRVTPSRTLLDLALDSFDLDPLSSADPDLVSPTSMEELVLEPC